jgi:hypothetical protein
MRPSIQHLRIAAECTARDQRAAEERLYLAREALHQERAFLEHLEAVRERVRRLEEAAEVAEMKQLLAQSRARAARQALEAAEGENAWNSFAN